MIDWQRLDRELLRRGLTNDQLARAAGVAAQTLSRARHGRNRMTERTFRKLAGTLARFPVVIGADEILVADPEAPAP